MRAFVRRAGVCSRVTPTLIVHRQDPVATLLTRSIATRLLHLHPAYQAAAHCR